MNSALSLNENRIRAACPNSRLFFFEQLGSTNDWALESASKLNLDQLIVVLARRQIAGRGRGENSWQAPPGSLTISFLFQPDLELFNRFQSGWLWPVAVSFASALSIRELIHSLAPTSNVFIKWPNDLLLGNAKVSGVLIETAWVTASRNSEEVLGVPEKQPIVHEPFSPKPVCVVGFGLNVNLQAQQIGSIAGSTIPGTSLSDHAGHPLDLSDVTIRLVHEFTRQMRRAAILGGDTTNGSHVEPSHALVRDYNHSLAWQGKRVCLEFDGTVREGRLLTVNSAGQLEVEMQGVVVRCDSSAVRTLRLAK